MHNFASTSPGPASLDSLDLYRVWDVDEDRAYDIKRTWPKWAVNSWGRAFREGSSPFVAVRTARGTGVVETATGDRHELGAGSILVRPWEDLMRWRTLDKNWSFFWFEFFASPADHLLPGGVLQQPLGEAELNEITLVFRMLRRQSEADRRYATARFAALLYGWARIHTEDPAEDAPHRARVERAIDLMHDRIAENLPITQIARSVDLNPRTFSGVFERVTGQTPKRYYIMLRLETARAMLASGRFNVQQTADRLGFSSPFHLSRAYKQQFGHPPSQAG
ncbi:MAG: helix-turn-helix domain-containing protein [Planctomycetota bacterium]